jgi:hypothetical protein
MALPPVVNAGDLQPIQVGGEDWQRCNEKRDIAVLSALANPANSPCSYFDGVLLWFQTLFTSNQKLVSKIKKGDITLDERNIRWLTVPQILHIRNELRTDRDLQTTLPWLYTMEPQKVSAAITNARNQQIAHTLTWFFSRAQLHEVAKNTPLYLHRKLEAIGNNPDALKDLEPKLN